MSTTTTSWARTKNEENVERETTTTANEAEKTTTTVTTNGTADANGVTRKQEEERGENDPFKEYAGILTEEVFDEMEALAVAEEEQREEKENRPEEMKEEHFQKTDQENNRVSGRDESPNRNEEGRS